MVDIEYANAYSEVLEILKYIPINDYNKIPKNKIELYKTLQNKEYVFIYNPNKTLEEQNASKITRAIIALLFRDYWASDEQRIKIKKVQNNERIKLEERKKEKYNINNFVESKEKNELEKQESNISEEKSLIKIQEIKWYTKIWNFFMNKLKDKTK